jgi:hypothetical protein
MTPAEIGEAVVAGRLSCAEGIRELMKLGYSEDLSREQIFIALGGDDVILTDENGVDRYAYSGKTIEEVRHLMN